jgi:hypothetical protein
LWFLPLGLAWCFIEELSSAPKPPYWWAWDVAFASSMVLCLIAANLQIPGFAWQQVTSWPGRVATSGKAIFAILRGRSDDFYAGCRGARNNPMLLLGRAKDLIGDESVDVMNYHLLAAVVNDLNYQPRPVIQGFVAYTPALQNLNLEYFQSPGRPHFVLLCHQATDGRFPTLEDSAALNYVLNNYVPMARDGRFLILQQRTAEVPTFQLVHEESLHFGDKLDLRPWAHGPLFMSVGIVPSLLGRAATLLYQQQPLYMRVSTGQAEARYRIVPSMAEQPFLVSPLLNSNFDVTNFYLSHPGKEPESVTFEQPAQGSFEFQDHLTVRLYTAPDFLHAVRRITAPRLLADLQGRVFWPLPKSVESAAGARVTIIHGTPALMVRAPSKIVVEIPENATSFSGYFGIPEEAYTGEGKTPGVEISVAVQDRNVQSRSALDRLLQPLSRAEDRGRFSFRIPVDSARDRTITLTTGPGPSGLAEGGWSVWSQCRFEEKPAH